MKIFKLSKLFKPRVPAFTSSSSLYTPVSKITFSTSAQQDETPVFILDPLPKEEEEKPQPFYVMFPLKNPLFPQSSYFTKISPAQQDILRKMKVRYVTAFLTKEAVSKDHRSDMSSYEPFVHPEPSEEPIIEDEPEIESPSAKRGRGRGRSQRDVTQQALFGGGDMSSVIIYDENISVGYGQTLVDDGTGKLVIKENEDAFKIPKLSANDVYNIGTLCKLTTQRLPTDDPNKPPECFAILKALNRVKLEKEIANPKDLRDYFIKTAKKEKPKPSSPFLFFTQPAAEVSPVILYLLFRK